MLHTKDIIQLIYTTAHDGQLLANLPFDKRVFKNKQIFTEWAVVSFNSKFCFFGKDEWKGQLPETVFEFPQLVKISSCVIAFTPEIKKWKGPKWYKEESGKIWYDELVKFYESHKHLIGIEKYIL